MTLCTQLGTQIKPGTLPTGVSPLLVSVFKQMSPLVGAYNPPPHTHTHDPSNVWWFRLTFHTMLFACRRCDGLGVHSEHCNSVGRRGTALYGSGKSHAGNHARSCKPSEGDEVRWRLEFPGDSTGLGRTNVDGRVFGQQHRWRCQVFTFAQCHLQRHRWAILTCLPASIQCVSKNTPLRFYGISPNL